MFPEGWYVIRTTMPNEPLFRYFKDDIAYIRFTNGEMQAVGPVSQYSCQLYRMPYKVPLLPNGQPNFLAASSFDDE